MKKKTTPSRRSPSATRPHGYDASGHLPQNYEQRLVEQARASRATDTDDAFVAAAYTDDDLAEELAEAAVVSMTTGEDELKSQLEAAVDEDVGGPFVETSAGTEFAGGTDESNIAEATREPFPTANGSEPSTD
jgi:hypothetical protein